MDKMNKKWYTQIVEFTVKNTIQIGYVLNANRWYSEYGRVIIKRL